jgi:hypothetical protein
VFESAVNYLDKFGPEVLVIQFGFLVILSTLFLWLWFSNRKKYHNLKHAIPANVVKSYLDSIIQNSTSLKSQLFRGGGLEAGGIPSVMPLGNLMGGDGIAISGAPSTALLEELNQKKAQISALEAQLASYRELEAKYGQSQLNLTKAEAKIKELEALLAQSKSGSPAGDNSALQAELSMVTKERDELRDKLREFEIIADDLANLKKLQQENEQLKRSLGGQAAVGPSTNSSVIAPADSTANVDDILGELDSAIATESAPDANQAMEDFLNASTDVPSQSVTDNSEAEMEQAMIAAQNNPAANEAVENQKQNPEKTPEDLLSEFEKMLG